MFQDRPRVDYGGPFSICYMRKHGSCSHKGYLRLSICRLTKVVHLEITSDFSKDCSIAAVLLVVVAAPQSIVISLVKESCIISWNLPLGRKPKAKGSQIQRRLRKRHSIAQKSHIAHFISNHTLTLEEFNILIIQNEALLIRQPLCSLH